MIATMEVRNLRATDRFPLPETFPHGWDFDRDWIWVAVEDDIVAGAILAGPMHGIVMVQVVYIRPGFGFVLLRLLRTFLRDCAKRGFHAFMGYVNIAKPEQKKLLRIAVRAEAIAFEDPMICFGGALKHALRW